MTDLAYRRVSRDTQSTERQAFLLKGEGFGEPDGVTVFEDPATSSKIPALERPGFKALAAVAVAGDTIKVAELFRLCRDLEDVIAVTKWCRARRISLRVLSGALSNIVDLAADDATTVMYVGILASVGQFQRDLQNELTRDGLRAANAAGRFGGRRPAIADPEAVRTAYNNGDGESIKALAKRFNVSRGAIRTALGTDPRQNAAQAVGEALPVPTVTLSMPGALADFLRVEETAPMEEGTATREALLEAETVRRGAGYSLSVTAPLAIHRELLDLAWTLAGGEGLDSSPSEIRAYRTYRDRIAQAATAATAAPREAKAEPAAVAPTLTPQEVTKAARRAKAGHTLYTAPDGTTRESKREYAAALAIFNPAEAIKAPWVESFHGTAALADKAGQGFARMGYRLMVVPVTTDGTTDVDLAARIAALRTEADTANIPAQEVATAEAKRDRAAADVARYQEREPDARFGETAETLAGWLAKAEEERDMAAATADHWRAQLTSA